MSAFHVEAVPLEGRGIMVALFCDRCGTRDRAAATLTLLQLLQGVAEHDCPDAFLKCEQRTAHVAHRHCPGVLS